MTIARISLHRILNKICKIHYITFQLIYNEYNKSCKEFLQVKNGIPIRQITVATFGSGSLCGITLIETIFYMAYRNDLTYFYHQLNRFVVDLILHISEEVRYEITFISQLKVAKL